MENTATINEKGDTITIVTTSKPQTAIYTFKNNAGNVIAEYTGVIPASLTPTSTISKEIKRLLDPENKLKTSVLNQEFTNIKELLQLQYDNLVLEEEELKIQQEQDKAAKQNELLNIASVKLQSLSQPLVYIGSLVDWITAGERNNIMYAFIVYAGQVILNNPISLIALGEASSGKSHIQTEALKLIPRQYILNEKKITESALFNRAKQDPYFYDGKIVNYGDMGGNHDHEFMEESKNLMKELQSDGFLNKPLNVPDDLGGGWKVVDLKLIGRPCLTYTTVPNHKFDDQELSRSMFITPRMDNKQIYDIRKSKLEYKFGKTYKLMKKYEQELRLVPFMISHLKEKLQNTVIVNPYVKFVTQFLSNSKYYKRDFDKFNGLLKTITALNYYNNYHTIIDDTEVLFTSINDVQLFISLLQPYHESISANIPPKAVEVLNDIRENIHNWTKTVNADDNLELEVGDTGITTNDYFAKSELGLSKDSVKRYMYELHEKGYLRVVGRTGKANIYNLAANELQTINNDLQMLSNKENKDLVDELGEDIAEQVKLHDKYLDGLDIMNQDENIMLPVWLSYTGK